MHGLSSIVASRFRYVQAQELRIPNQWGITHSYSRGTHQLPHLWPLISPYISQKPLSKKLSPKVLFFSTLSKILETVHSTLNRLERSANAPYSSLFLWLLSLKDPQFFALHASVWGECCSLKPRLKHGQKLENFVFLTQNHAIWWILLGANLIKVMKTKFQFYRLNRLSTDPIVMEELHWRAGMIHRSSYPGQTRKGIYPTPGSLNKCQVHLYLKLCEQRHFKCKVQCRARWRARENFEI